MCQENKKIKAIFNLKNYGSDKSSFNALKYATGDAAIMLHMDLEEEITVVEKFLNKWEEGSNYVVGQKIKSDENTLVKLLKKIYYIFYNFTSKFPLVKNTALFLISKKYLQFLKFVNDPDPFTRGIFSEIFDEPDIVKITQQKRKFGTSKNNLYSIFKFGIKGLLKSSTSPIRLYVTLSIIISLICALSLVSYYLLFTNTNLMHDIIFYFLLILIFISFGLFVGIGIIVEYLMILLNFSKNLKVIEKEKINFDETN